MRGHLRKHGPSWQVFVDAGRDPITGKRRQVSGKVRGTKKQAQEVLGWCRYSWASLSVKR